MLFLLEQENHWRDCRKLPEHAENFPEDTKSSGQSVNFSEDSKSSDNVRKLFGTTKPQLMARTLMIFVSHNFSSSEAQLFKPPFDGNIIFPAHHHRCLPKCYLPTKKNKRPQQPLFAYPAVKAATQPTTCEARKPLSPFISSTILPCIIQSPG